MIPQVSQGANKENFQKCGKLLAKCSFGFQPAPEKAADLMTTDSVPRAAPGIPGSPGAPDDRRPIFVRLGVQFLTGRNPKASIQFLRPIFWPEKLDAQFLPIFQWTV